MKSYTLQELQDAIVPFIESEYPKGEDTELRKRGQATAALTLFTLYLRNRDEDSQKK